jgi:uncharacterized membrane protein (UPF0127 family)
MSKKIIQFILLVVLSGFFLYFYQSYLWRFFIKDGQIAKFILKENYFSTPKKELLVEIVVNQASTQRGLSNRAQLSTVDEKKLDGMLFIFPEQRIRQFWMKDMLFDIDICWFKDERLFDCTRKAVQPKSEKIEDLLIYQSPTKTDMVLETMPNFLPDEILESKLFFSFF